MHNRTILFVEDEPLVRECAELALSMSGYNVVCVEDGVTAMEAAEGMNSDLQLLITDVALPGILGTDLVKELRCRYPSLPVIYVSGYDIYTCGVEIEPAESTAFLQKPYSPAKLIDMVKSFTS